MSAGLVSAEAPVPGLQVAALSLCPHVAFPLCLPIPGIPSSSYEDTSQAELELTRMTSFDLNDFLKGPMSKYNHIGCSGLRSLWSALPEHESSILALTHSSPRPSHSTFGVCTVGCLLPVLPSARSSINATGTVLVP